MDAIRQTITRTALGFAEYMTPVLKESKFRETGVITPAEFVAAGDFLVHHCPTWQWCTGDQSKVRPFLPAEKQYLFTKGVPCYKRANQLFDMGGSSSRIIEEQDVDGGWVDTCYIGDKSKNEAAEVDGESGDNDVDVPPESNDDCDESDDEEAEDFDAYLQSGALDKMDPDSIAERVCQPSGAAAAKSEASKFGDGVLQTRTYDLYITYDKYYQTARFWLTGYDENHVSLNEDQMNEDFSQDHVKKTITVEAHPHLSGVSMPSIHPCRQAELMKKLMDMIESDSTSSAAPANPISSSTASESASAAASTTSMSGLSSAGTESSGSRLGVHQYLMVFLKFVQTVIPTVEYDFTRNVKI